MRLPREARTGPMLRSAVAAPFVRVFDGPWYSDLAAITAAITAFLTGHPFYAILAAATFGMIADLIAGGVVAKRRDDFRWDLFRYGLASKGIGLCVAFMLQWLEQAAAQGVTHGAFAAAFVTALAVGEMKSLDEKYFDLTGGHLPLLGRIIAFLEGVTERAVPGSPRPQPDGDR